MTGAVATGTTAPDPRRRRREQFRALMALELHKSLLSLRGASTWILAALPAGLAGLYFVSSVLLDPEVRGNTGQIAIVFSIVYQTLVLRFVLFLACLWVFMNAMRGEILDRTLHFYLLAPMRRELLLAAKFAAGVIAVSVPFLLSLAACEVLLFLPAGVDRFVEHLAHGPGFGHLVRYAAATVLGVLAYGALFLLLGMYFRNAIVVGLAFWGWEASRAFLPGLLKKLTVAHYLESISPLPPPESGIELMATPIPTWQAVSGILLVTAVALVAAMIAARGLQVNYSDD